MKEFFIFAGIDGAKQHAKAQELAKQGISSIVHEHSVLGECVDTCKVYTGKIY